MTASERSRIWAKAHPERRREIELKYRRSEKAIAKKRAYFKAYYQSHREQYARHKKEWEKKHPRETCLRVCRLNIKHRMELRGWYIRRLLSCGTTVPVGAWPESVVEAKRAEMKLKRLWQPQRILKSYETSC